MPRANGHRFTIYDKLEADGAFAANPANSYARGPNGENLFSGPIQFPQMLYHPKGEQQVTVQGEIMNTPLGAHRVGEQRELVHKIVGSEAELKAALAAGWHTHPALANRARIEGQIESGQLSEEIGQAMLEALPLVNPISKMKELEEELAQLRREKAASLAAAAVPAKPAVPTKP